MLGIRLDHRRHRIEMKFCVVAGLQEVVLRFEFYQNRLSGFGAVGQINEKGQISIPHSSETA